MDQALEAKIVSVLFSERNFTNLERRLQAYRLKLATRNADQVPKLKAMLVQEEAKISRVVNKVADDVIDDDVARGLLPQRDIKRKLKILEYAQKVGNISKACRYFGISRQSFSPVEEGPGRKR